MHAPCTFRCHEDPQTSSRKIDADRKINADGTNLRPTPTDRSTSRAISSAICASSGGPGTAIRHGGALDWSPVVAVATLWKKPIERIVQIKLTSAMQRMTLNGEKGNATTEDFEVGTSRWPTLTIGWRWMPIKLTQPPSCSRIEIGMVHCCRCRLRHCGVPVMEHGASAKQ